MKKTFVSNLLKTANYLGKDHGLPKTADIQEATGMVLTHIITSVLGEAEHSGCYLLPTESHVEEKHVEKVVVVGAAFLCFVGTSLYFCLKDEGIELQINDITAGAGTATFMFSFLETGLKERNAKLLHEGIEHYKKIIQSAKNNDKTLEYANTIMQAVDLYIRGQVCKDQSKNEKMIGLFVSFYMTLFNAFEAEEEEEGEEEEEVVSLKQAIRDNPDDAQAHYNLGAAYLLLNDRGSALKQYKILKSLDPELAKKLINLSNSIE